MANWTLYFGVGGIGFGGEIPSAFIDDIDVELTKVPNAQDGSSHTATSPVSISGAGIVAPGAFYASGATLIVPAYAAWQATHAYTGGVSNVTNGGNLYYCLISGTSAGAGGPTGTATTPIVDGTVTWSYVSPAPASGYGLTIASGAKAQINGGTLDVQAGGFLNVNSLGFLVILSGGNEIVESGGQIAVQPGGTISLSGSGALGPYGEIAVGAYGLIQVQANGSEVFLSNSILQVNSGAIFSMYSTETVEPDGSIVWGGTSGHPGTAVWQNFATATFQSGSTATFQSGSTLAGNAGSPGATLNWAGPATLSGATTISGAATLTSGGTLNQQGVRTKNGATGYDAERTTTVTASGTIANPQQYDLILWTQTGSTATFNLTLGTPPSVAGIRVRVAISGTQNFQAQGAVNVIDQTTGYTMVKLNSSGGVVAGTSFFVDVESFFNGSAWQWVAIGQFST